MPSSPYDERSERMPPRSRLELDDDPAFQRRDWRFERAGWAAILLIVLAGLAGLFGHGPLSAASASASDRSLRVEYDRFERHGSPARLTLAIPAPRDSVVAVWVSANYLHGIRLERIVPQPRREIAASGGTIYEVATGMADDTARIVLRFQPEAIGATRLRVGIPGRVEVSRRQFVYP